MCAVRVRLAIDGVCMVGEAVVIDTIEMDKQYTGCVEMCTEYRSERYPVESTVAAGEG